MPAIVYNPTTDIYTQNRIASTGVPPADIIAVTNIAPKTKDAKHIMRIIMDITCKAVKGFAGVSEREALAVFVRIMPNMSSHTPSNWLNGINSISTKGRKITHVIIILISPLPDWSGLSSSLTPLPKIPLNRQKKKAISRTKHKIENITLSLPAMRVLRKGWN